MLYLCVIYLQMIDLSICLTDVWRGPWRSSEKTLTGFPASWSARSAGRCRHHRPRRSSAWTPPESRPPSPCAAPPPRPQRVPSASLSAFACKPLPFASLHKLNRTESNRIESELIPNRVQSDSNRVLFFPSPVFSPSLTEFSPVQSILVPFIVLV